MGFFHDVGARDKWDKAFPLVGKWIRRELYPDHEFGGFSAMLKEHGVQLYSSDVIPAIELIF
jgi:hypothetical protein